MALAIKKLSAERPTTAAKVTLVKPVALKKSTMLDVFDIPIEDLIESKENPNEQDEATFDQLVQIIKDNGFDEPIKVVPAHGKPGKYIIYSGHHRFKVAKVLKYTAVPCVIKEGWSEDERKIALIRENHLRGNTNPQKFTQLWNEMSKKYDASILKLQMGITKEDVFKKLYKAVEQNLNPAQKKKLAEAKEKISSIDGLSSVLNNIFKDKGSDLDHGFVVFNFGGKNHHYVESDKQLNGLLEKLEDEIRSKGLMLSDVFKALLANPDLSKIKKSDKVETRKTLRLKK
jgi:ParB/RepB/Spo0J family partition protein